MTEKRKKRRRYLYPAAAVLLVLCAVFFSGCSSRKYEAVSLEALEGNAAESGGTDSEGSGTDSTGAEESGADGSGEETQETSEELRLFTMGESQGETGGAQEAGADTPETEAAAFEDVDEVVAVLEDGVNIREAPGEDARIYVQLKAGSTLQRTGINGEWSRVIYDGNTAYVSSALVEPCQVPEETEAVLPAGAEPETEAVPAETAADSGETAGSQEAEIPFNGYTVAIDAGHQAKANAEKEPIGPGSETMKAKMPGGNVGVDTGVKECDLTLAVAKKLETELKNRGYHVVMIRESNDVNLSSAERSQLANASGAQVLVRLHANSTENSGIYGTLAMCMTDQNPYNAQLHGKSYTLSKKLVDSICAHTGARNRGVQEVDNSSDLNWSEIPVSVVEMGFLSNPDEDRLLQDETYRDSIAAGIAEALDSYFAEGN